MPQFLDAGQISRLMYGLARADANSDSSLPGMEDIVFKDDATNRHLIPKNTAPLIGGVYVSFP